MSEKALAAKNEFIQEDIQFDFDSSTLLPAAQNILRKKAAWLQNNSDESIIIEGHCDERGTVEYNLALGERRAAAAKAFLVDLGVAGSRMEIVSYGEEKPIDMGNYESAWAKNRRAHFTIK